MQAAATALLAKQHRHSSLRRCTSSAQIAPPSLLTLLAASGSLPAAAVTNDGQCHPTIPVHPPIPELASLSPNGGGPLQNTAGELEAAEALQCAVSWVKVCKSIGKVSLGVKKLA